MRPTSIGERSTGGVSVSELKLMKELEAENAKLVAVQALNC